MTLLQTNQIDAAIPQQARGGPALEPDESASVTVVIACHDEKRWLSILQTIQSVADQVPLVPAVIVAVDHNAWLSEQLRESCWGVLVVDNDTEHRGASATRNVGAFAAGTDLIAFLDDDEVAEPEWLARLVGPFADPAVIGTGGRYQPVWDHRRPGWFPDELAWVVGGHHSGMPAVPTAVRNVWAGNMAVRAEAFRRVGGFRLGFGKVGSRSRPEDTDLCIRVATASPGTSWLYLPDARIHHTVPLDRSSFRFYVGRCYAEGSGKVELHTALQLPDTLNVEREYLRRVIPVGIVGHLKDAGSCVARAGAILVGVGAAGVGAAASTLRDRASRWPR